MGRKKTYGVRTEKRLKKELIECLKENNGRIYKSLRVLDIQPTIFYNWKRDDNFYKEEIDETLSSIKELLVDEAEEQLERNIRSGNQRALEYFLNNHGKSRGFNEKETISHEPVKINIVSPSFKFGGENEDPDDFKFDGEEKPR